MFTDSFNGSFSRHTESARHGEGSETHPAITDNGIEIARETARVEILQMLDRAPAGTVFFIGAKTDMPRTGETAEVYGEELKRIAAERNDLIVLTKSEIDKRREEIRNMKEGDRIIDEITDLVRTNPDAKIVIDYPLFIKQMGMAYQDRWVEHGKKSKYFSEIGKKYNGDYAAAIYDWIGNKGKLELEDGTVIQGPIPEDVAKQYLEGLSRVYDFAKQLVGGSRTVMVHGTGHQYDLDAVATYLAKGEVSEDAFRKVMGRPEASLEDQGIGESEVISDIYFDSATGDTVVRYRGKEFKGNLFAAESSDTTTN